MSQAQGPKGSSTANNDGIPAPSGAANLIDTDYVLGQDNIRGRYLVNLDIHGTVFIVSALRALLFVVLALALHNEVEPLFKAVRDWLTQNLATTGPYYIESRVPNQELVLKEVPNRTWGMTPMSRWWSAN